MIRVILGYTLIATGIVMGTFHFFEWHIGRSAAEEMTDEELSALNNPETILPMNIKGAEEVLPNPSGIEPKDKAPAVHATNFSKGDKVAYLMIPKLKQKYSVFLGTDDRTLKKGVGMFTSKLTTTPDGGGHTVLSGHRDTVFYGLDKLENGDLLTVSYHDSIYTYKINKIFITDPEDRSVIVKKDTPTLTLTTCYPFNYVGSAPERYIIQAEPVN
ncbi:class D sortase [Bacillus sp. FJAT-27225]|uniref:class D sortase n=1 Tax=Bacillus sp. FJAT-27225 TaxID=1743144 RepID=UPI00080C2841|nr:class D sortase [Bacillus sp. FJAT-27225]OCA85908.1 class D sortase [Bacillus sp. FJAT-27225]